MSKPFKSWVRLAIVVSLSIFTPFNSALAGRWMERWTHRPSCRSLPVCEFGTAVVGIDGCSPCGDTGIIQSSSNACCDCVPGGPAVEGGASDHAGEDSASFAPTPPPDKSVPWTRIEPATPAEKPSNAKPDAEPAAEPKMKKEGSAAPFAPVAPVPVIPSEDSKGEDEPEADEAKPREVDEKPANPDIEPAANKGDPAPAPSETEEAVPSEAEAKEAETSEPAFGDQPEMEDSAGTDNDEKDLVEPEMVEPEMAEDTDGDAKGSDNQPPIEPEPSIDDLFGAPKAAAPDSKQPSAEALKESDAEDAAKKIEESIDDLFGKPVNFGPSIDRVSPPVPRPSDAGNASNSSPGSSTGKPTGVSGKSTGVSTPESKGRNEGAEKNGSKFRLNQEEPKKGKGAGIEDELDRIFRSKTFVPPTKFQGAEFRNWTDNTGAYSIQARVAVIFGDKVRLLKENGKYTTVPMERLSDFDRSYVQWVAESLTYRASKIVRNNDADEMSPEMAR